VNLAIRRSQPPRPDSQAERNVLEYAEVLKQGVMLEDESDASLADLTPHHVLAVKLDFTTTVVVGNL
jgi:hypothetical protein